MSIIWYLLLLISIPHRAKVIASPTGCREHPLMFPDVPGNLVRKRWNRCSNSPIPENIRNHFGLERRHRSRSRVLPSRDDVTFWSRFDVICMTSLRCEYPLRRTSSCQATAFAHLSVDWYRVTRACIPSCPAWLRWSWTSPVMQAKQSTSWLLSG